MSDFRCAACSKPRLLAVGLCHECELLAREQLDNVRKWHAAHAANARVLASNAAIARLASIYTNEAETHEKYAATLAEVLSRG